MGSELVVVSQATRLVGDSQMAMSKPRMVRVSF